MSALALVARDVALALRLGGGGAVAVAFFVLTVVLVPLGVGADRGVLSEVAGGLLWLAALLAVLLSLDRLFQADFEDGTLDQLMLSPVPLEQVVLAKALAHWLTTGLAMTLIAPVLGLMLGLSPLVLPWLGLAMLLGTPSLSLIGAIGAALTVGVRRGGLLLSILVLPLYVPTLVLGARVVADATAEVAAGVPVTPGAALMLTAALSLFCLALAPFAAAGALRINAR